jgi:hypothetical protein
MLSHKRNAYMTSPEKAAKHEDLMPLLTAMFREFQEASKKKPDAALNKRKVEIVNRLLRDVLSIIEGESTRAYLDLLDEDDVPQNSDVALILGQAVAAMIAFKQKYYRRDLLAGGPGWATAETHGTRER